MTIASPDHPVVARLMEDYSRQFHGATPLASGTVEYEYRKAVGALEGAGFRIVFPPAQRPLLAEATGDAVLEAISEAINRSNPGALDLDRAAQVRDGLEELGFIIGETTEVMRAVSGLSELMAEHAGHGLSQTKVTLDHVAAIVGIPGPSELARRAERERQAGAS